MRSGFILYMINYINLPLFKSLCDSDIVYLYSVAMFAYVKPILLYGDRSRENSVGVHHLVVTNGLEVKQ